jgi:glucose-6-phosphate 1-dehydrogenase
MKYKVGQKENFKDFNLVVFGGTGDLAYRKIYPALYHRFISGESKIDFTIVTIHRKELAEKEFFENLKTALESSVKGKLEEKKFSVFAQKFRLILTIENTIEGFSQLAEEINKTSNRQNIFYLSTPSSVFGEIATALKGSNLVNEDSKVVVEKPLGFDLKSSIEINNLIVQAFEESQIYRIDHYLGKETVQNLMVLRFANNLFERAWNCEGIDSIQITVAESLGVGTRSGYYDSSGALRDMVQNHLLQLLCLVAMEPPVSLDANNVRDEKLKVLKALRMFNANTVQTDTIKGQYTRGNINKRKSKFIFRRFRRL